MNFNIATVVSHKKVGRLTKLAVNVVKGLGVANVITQ